MSPTVTAVRVVFDDRLMWVDLSDGRITGVPRAWFPSLLNATEHDWNDHELSQRGKYRDALDEDISVEGLLTLSSLVHYRL